MNKIILIIFLSTSIFACSHTDCSKYSSDYVPNDLYEAIEFMDCNWSAEDKTSFANKDEKTAVVGAHMGVGLGIRNSWGLWGDNNDLKLFFNSNGIFHPDDISSIIIRSFHRKLNKKEIDFEGQVQYYIDYWKPINEFETRETARAISSFNHFLIGDSISAFLEIDPSEDKYFAFTMIGRDYEWTFDPNKDLRIDGVLLNKSIHGDSSNVDFIIRITHLNKADSIRTAWGEVHEGDTTTIDIKYLRYE